MHAGDTRPDMIHPVSDRVSEEQIGRALRHSAATLHESAGRLGALTGAIKPLVEGWELCGPAYTAVPTLCAFSDEMHNIAGEWLFAERIGSR